MARYAPLPSIDLDPRNEAQLVQDASQRVYEASNQTLNDFSAGNPLAALLEGQAFAQGEFLFWANQLPQSILIEWIGPFLGAMRRLGTPATARLDVSVTPSKSNIEIPAGTTFTTDSNLTGGVSATFISQSQVTIPAGESFIQIPVYSQFVGSQYNVPANSITGSSTASATSLVVTNPSAAQGGSDVETYQEVQERFFTLIRRKNPVSAEDWQAFFEDFYGSGTLTSVQPNRPNQGTYNYVTDYKVANGQTSFFVLGPNATELDLEQLQRGQNVVNFSVPAGTQGHVYPLTLSQVQYNLKVEIDANGPWGANLKSTSLNFRDRLFNILQPGNVFPATIDPTVSDVDAAFYNTFASDIRFQDPHIEISGAYNTPPLLDASAATYTQVYAFEPTADLLSVNDLVEISLPISSYYPVLSDFTPYSSEKKDQPIYGNLQLQQIRKLTANSYLQGQVAYWDVADGGDGQLHVILENVVIESSNAVTIASYINIGKVSGAKTYTAWTVGNSYVENVSGAYNPQIIEYNYAADEFIPDPTSLIPLNQRPGALVWVVAQNFTLQASTNSVTGAQTSGLLGPAVTPLQLKVEDSYVAGQWVFTPQIGPGPDPVADPYYNYVDIRQGVVNKYAYVISNFKYNPDTLTVSEYFDSLVAQGVIKEIIVEVADEGLPLVKYEPRFPVGTYLEYRSDASQPPAYYIAANYFTPNSTDINDLLAEQLVFPVAYNAANQALLAQALFDGTVRKPVRMFTFFRGDRTYFRQGSKLFSYTATSNVTPLFQFYIYLQNGIFVPTETDPLGTAALADYIPFFNPNYANYAEDTIVSEDGRNYYRVMRAFTPPLTDFNWTNTTVTNTARIEEYKGNLLRYVNFYECEQDILSQLGRDVSAIKLGIAQITLIPKNSRRFSNSLQELTYVWENTSSFAGVPELSWYTGTNYGYNPPNYATGTLNL